MIERLKILAKIDDIEEEHCASCTIDTNSSNKYCYTKCDIGKGLRSLGDQLLGNRQNKVKETLAKGKNMTTTEVKYLLDQGVTRNKLGRIIGVPATDYARYFDDLEEGIELTTKLEQVREIMQKDKDIKAKDLAKKIGSSVASTYNFMGKIKNESEQPKETPKAKPVAKGKPKEAAPNKLERENKTLKAELKAVEKEKVGLEQINENQLDIIKQRNEKIKDLEQELSDYKQGEIAIADSKTIDLEKEVERLKKMIYKRENRIVELIDESKQEINKLHTELDRERASHEKLSKYAVILMQKENEVV